MTTANTINAEPGAKPPPNLIDPEKWSDLHEDKSPAHFLAEFADQEHHKFTASNRMRQVLEALMRGPVVAANRCRISDQVLPLRRYHGLDIVCTIYRNDSRTERTKFGVYTLNTRVRRIDGEAS